MTHKSAKNYTSKELTLKPENCNYSLSQSAIEEFNKQLEKIELELFINYFKGGCNGKEG